MKSKLVSTLSAAYMLFAAQVSASTTVTLTVILVS